MERFIKLSSSIVETVKQRLDFQIMPGSVVDSAEGLIKISRNIGETLI